jgi:hypothetical protein
MPQPEGVAWEPAPAGGQPWGAPGEQAQQYPAYPVSYAPQPDDGATQMFPPYPQDSVPLARPDDNRMPPPYPSQPAPVGPADDTQMFPPYPQAAAPLPLPPEVEVPPVPSGAPFGIRPGIPEEGATQFLSPYPQAAAPGDTANPTQQLPVYSQSQPQQGQQGQQQDDFDHLYRRPDAPTPPGPGPQPQYQQSHYQQQAPPSYQPGGAGERQRKKLSPPALIGLVVVGCAVVGLGAGAALSSGDSGSGNSATATASQSAAASGPASPPAAGVSVGQTQAQKLDALLKESGSSRSSVISAVANIRACQQLGQAGTDLRAAATQRDNLVTELATLQVDQLADHQALTTALTRAWKASSAADIHYAAWADEAAGGKICHKGSARNTSQTADGDRASITATQAKQTAVKLWNVIARQYGLPQRAYTQL